MVNINALVYIHTNLEVTTFGSVSSFRTWQLNRCRNQAQKDQLNDYYNVRWKAEERYLEREFNLNRGLLTNIHQIFRSLNRIEQSLVMVDILNSIQEEHCIVLELRPSKYYNVATIYTRERQFSITVDYQKVQRPVELSVRFTEPASLTRNS